VEKLTICVIHMLFAGVCMHCRYCHWKGYLIFLDFLGPYRQVLCNVLGFDH
jgi:hypothetical protein